MIRSTMCPANGSKVLKRSSVWAIALLAVAVGFGRWLPSAQAMCFDNGSCCDCNAPCCDHPCAAHDWLDGQCHCVLAVPDSDGDGWPNQCDNCPWIPNAHPLNTCVNDGPWHGLPCHYDSQCNSAPGVQDGYCFTAQLDDIDGDGVGDLCDNCPVTPNSDQADSDADGVGDACAPARSHIHYLIELGGNNHAELFTPTFKPRFTPGTRAPGQHFTAGSIVTWDVRVSVSGRHYKPGAVGHGLFTNGAEGLSFDIELRQGSPTGPLVDIGAGSAQSAGWFSTVETDRNAAFACIFNIGGHGSLGGRVIDPSSAGGPGLDYYEYPAAASRPAASFIPRGMVGSQTAVYFSYSNAAQTAGVGVSGPTGLAAGGCPGLGILPVFEGQINTTGLGPGTYVLKVTPRGGNILPGNFTCPTGTPTKIAAKANELHGDQITFSLTTP